MAKCNDYLLTSNLSFRYIYVHDVNASFFIAGFWIKTFWGRVNLLQMACIITPHHMLGLDFKVHYEDSPRYTQKYKTSRNKFLSLIIPYPALSSLVLELKVILRLVPSSKGKEETCSLINFLIQMSYSRISFGTAKVIFTRWAFIILSRVNASENEKFCVVMNFLICSFTYEFRDVEEATLM